MEWRSVVDTVLEGEELERPIARALSFVLLAFALACAWLPHSQTWWFVWETQVSFTPNFLSGALALAVVMPLYVRRIVPYPGHSFASLLFLAMNLALTATFIQIILGKGTGLGTTPALVVVSCAVALSWLGMRAAAGMAWLALLGVGMVSALASNSAWGLPGFGFVLGGFGGVLLQTDLGPGRLVAELMEEYRLGGAPGGSLARTEPSAAASSIGELGRG